MPSLSPYLFRSHATHGVMRLARQTFSVTTLPKKENLLNGTKSELVEKFIDLGMKKYTAMQVNDWIYKKGVFSFKDMTNISKHHRALLQERFDIFPGDIKQCQTSKDGTKKWLLQFEGKDGVTKNSDIETVYIPTESTLEHSRRAQSAFSDQEVAVFDERGSVCVSSQVGCSLTCSFCHTGTMSKRMLRNLTSGEIVGQVLTAKKELGEFDSMRTATDPRRVSNVVFMGMGEPLMNYKNVKTALGVLMDRENGLGMGRRKVTVSTSGVVPMIAKLGEDCGVNLAISLHATNDDLRDELVPINKQYPLRYLVDECRRYPGVKQHQMVTWEYVMLDGVNDSMKDAKNLIQVVKGIPSLVNLIPFNPWEGSPYKSSSYNQIRRFQQVLQEESTLNCTIRWPRGRDIMGACGQLAVLNDTG